MASMPQDPPLWRQALDAAVKFFIGAELKIEEARVRVSEGVRDIAEIALNFTTTALQHLAHPIRPFLRFDNRSTFKTFLLGPGCDVISPSCIVRQCNTSEDLRAVMPIAAGPYAFDTTTSYVNIDAWSFPVFYVYDPNYSDNYTRGIGDHHDDIFRGSTKNARLRADPVFRYPALPSADKALALSDLHSGAGLKNDNIIPVGVLAFFYIFVVFCGLYHFGVLPLGRYIVRKYNTYPTASQDTHATSGGPANCNDEELQIEQAYIVTLNNLSENVDRKHADLQQSESERASFQSQLLDCKSEKVDIEKQLRDCTSQKKAVESSLRKCESDKENVEKTLNEMASAQIETLQKVNALETKLGEAQKAQTEAETAQRDAREEVASVRKDATARFKLAEEDAEKRVKTAEQDAEKKVKQARADANKEVTDANNKAKQAKDEAEKKAESAQLEADKEVESIRQKSGENLKSAQQKAEAKLESAKQDANETAKLAEEEAEKKLKSTEEAAKAELKNATTEYKQREEDLQAELSTAKTTIQELKPYKDEAAKQSKEAAGWQKALINEKEEHRQHVEVLNEKHSAVLEELQKQHDDKDESRREQQEVAMQEQEEKHREQVSKMQGEIDGHVVVRLNLATAEDAIKASEKTTKSLRQRLSQLQDDTRDYQDLKTENEKLSSEKSTLQTQVQTLDNQIQTKAHDFEKEERSLKIKLQDMENQQTTTTARFEADQKSLQAKCQEWEEQLKTATTKHQTNQKSLQAEVQEMKSQLDSTAAQRQSTEKSLQAQVKQATEFVSRVEAASKDLSQKVDVLKEEKKLQAESIVSKDDIICRLQDNNRKLVSFKEGVETELPAMKNALEKAERSDKEINQDLKSTADNKKKRRNRRKHRNGKYSTDRQDDANHSESDSMSEDSPAAQTVQQPIQQPLGSPIEEEVEEVTERLSNLAFDDDTANSEGVNAREAAETDASDSGSSSIRSTFRFLPDAVSFVPALEAQPAITGFSRQPEASTTPMKPEFTRAEITRAEGRTHTPTVAEEGIAELEKRSSPVSSPRTGTNVSNTSTPAKEVHERQEAYAASPISTPSVSLSEKDRSAAATQDQPLVVSTGNVSRIEAEKIDVNGDTAILHVSASSSRVESEPPSVSRAPIASGSPTAAQSSTAKALQRVNTEPSTPTADIKLHEPKYGRPDFVTEELAAQRAEDLKKSMWAAQTSAFRSSASGRTRAPCKAAQIFKSCIDDAKGDKAGKNLQNSRWADVAPGIQTPVGPTARLPQQTVAPTSQSGESTTSAVAASKAMPPASPSLAVKPPSPADPAPVAPASATLSPAAANPVSASTTEASAATASTTVAPVSAAVPVRASQYTSSANATAARSSDTPQRGRGTGIGSGRGIGRGRGGRGGAGRGGGTGRGMMQNHELPNWLAEDLARQAAEAQSSVTTLPHAPSTANHPSTVVPTAMSAPEQPSKTIDQRTASATSSVQGVKAEIKDQLSNTQSATNNDTATPSRPVPNSQFGSSTLQSKHTAKPGIQHQLFESKYATNSSSSNDTTTTSRPRVKNDLLQSKYATND